VAEDVSRREFLRTAARFLALGGIGMMAARLTRMGRGTQVSGPEICVNDGVCRGCVVFADCGLPAALSAKQRAPWARRGS